MGSIKQPPKACRSPERRGKDFSCTSMLLCIATVGVLMSLLFVKLEQSRTKMIEAESRISTLALFSDDSGRDIQAYISKSRPVLSEGCVTLYLEDGSLTRSIRNCKIIETDNENVIKQFRERYSSIIFSPSNLGVNNER